MACHMSNKNLHMLGAFCFIRQIKIAPPIKAGLCLLITIYISFYLGINPCVNVSVHFF